MDFIPVTRKSTTVLRFELLKKLKVKLSPPLSVFSFVFFYSRVYGRLRVEKHDAALCGPKYALHVFALTEKLLLMGLWCIRVG